MRVGPRSEGSEETHHARSLVKSNSVRLRHFLLPTSVPFDEIAPTKFGNREERCYTSIIQCFLGGLFHAEIVEVEIGGVAIYRSSGEFRRAKSYCHLYGAQGQ
ncbi:hypothetical protein TNCV_1478251 [Trichonephila clavipes]|nr:hypothetical protein TNCV_1478251 [Trichonephila clavipes]